MNTPDKKTNRQRINEAIAKQQKASVNVNRVLCKTCGNWAQANGDFSQPHHPNCPHAAKTEKAAKPGQAQRRQKRIDVLFERLPDGTVMEQTYSRARGWLLKMVVPMVQTGPGEQPFVKEFYHTGPKHLPAIEELYLKYRDWIKKSMVEATKTDG